MSTIQDNWLRQAMEARGLTTSELSRILEQEYHLTVSRQVLDNWLRMEDERIPVPVANIPLVCALANIFGYHDIYLFLEALGYPRFVTDYTETEEWVQPGVPKDMVNLLARLGTLRGEQAEGIAILLEQILDRWDEVGDLLKNRGANGAT